LGNRAVPMSATLKFPNRCGVPPTPMYTCRSAIRHYKTILLLAGLTFYASVLSAQFIFTAKKRISIFRSTIDKNERIQLRDSIPYAYIRIIDSRYDTAGIGFFLDSWLILEGPSHIAALQNVMDHYYLPICIPGSDTLIIQLEKLSIQDQVIRDTGLVITSGNIKTRFYKGRNNAYQYLGSADTLFQEKYNPIARIKTHKNGNHTNYEFWDYYLLRLFESMIRRASRVTDSMAISKNLFVRIEEIKSEGLHKRDMAILHADSLHPGFYRNFSEFINNNPTFNFVNAEALKNVLEVMHYRVGNNISHEEPDTSYWGYCVGRRIFIRYKYDFFQLMRKDCGFYIAPTLDARRQAINQGALNLLIGLAALGGSIAAKSSPEFSGFNALQTPEIPMIILKSGDNLVLGLQLDLDTGEVTY
jgi:hypothetical protein